MPVELDLTGRSAIVTGAGSGIGLACAQLLAEAGAHLIVSDVDESAAQAGARQIVQAGGSAVAERLDISSADSCRDLAARYVGAATPHILVNSAAIWTIGDFARMDVQRWQRDLSVTLNGPMILTSALLPAMCALEDASIVNISSDAGRIGEVHQVVYSAAKAGIIGFTKALAREVGRHGVRVNCVAPGLTRTKGAAPFLDAVPPETIKRNYPLGRLGEAVDIANLVVFLASDRASWITGQTISVSGGYTTAG
jgi:NAD(P)-dependent dehydrogenase (short-subunit alcohol dehydrogenase family)